MTICMETLFNRRIEKLYKLVVSKIRKQVYKFKSYLWKRRLEKVFKETKEVVSESFRWTKTKDPISVRYGNTPNFSSCLKEDSTKPFSDNALFIWKGAKEDGQGVPIFPPISRYEGD